MLGTSSELGMAALQANMHAHAQSPAERGVGLGAGMM